MSATRNPNLISSPIRAKRKRLFLIRTTIILFIFFVFLFGLAIFSGNEKIMVKTIHVVGNAAVLENDILPVVQQNLGGRYLYLFARGNSLIFPRSQIKKELLNKFKTINGIQFSRPDWQTIQIIVSERKPHSAWCGWEVVKLSDCYFVDDSGLIYGRAPIFSGNLFIKNYGFISTSTDPIGQIFLSSFDYRKVFKLIQTLEQKGLDIIATAAIDHDFKFILINGPQIIFNLESLETAFNNLFSALEAKSLDLTSEQNTIEYVDLRFDNKIVIKRKE